MLKRETVRLIDAAQMEEVSSALTEAIPTDLPFDVAKYWASHKSKLGKEVAKILWREIPNFSGALQSWSDLYHQHFNLNPDFSEITVLGKKEGFDRFIVVAPGVTSNGVMNALKKLMPTSQYYDDLDKAIVTNDRVATNKSYAIWIRDRVEADEENKNRSANDLAKAEVPGITLLERLLLELKYFTETGEHLDLKVVTLCVGSRYGGGSVPHVYWRAGKLRVGYYDPDDARDSVRSRVVVS